MKNLALTGVSCEFEVGRDNAERLTLWASVCEGIVGSEYAVVTQVLGFSDLVETGADGKTPFRQTLYTKTVELPKRGGMGFECSYVGHTVERRYLGSE